MIVEILTGAIIAGTVVLFAVAGEIISQRAGIINLGIEGGMLAGALSAFSVTVWTGNPWLGAVAGGLAGAAMSLIHAFLVISRNANQLASGLTLMFLGMGITAFFGRSMVNEQIQGFHSTPIPFLSDIPIVGHIFFNHDPLTYISYLLIPALWWFLFKTNWGVILRASGENEEVVYAYGKSPMLIRYLAVVVGGFLAGIGGAQLSIAYTHTWIEDMVQGRGVIAGALVIFASWLPFRGMLGAYLFGGAFTLQLVFQGRGVEISPYLLFMLPYVLIIIALYIVERKQRNMMPQGLRKVFMGSNTSQ